VVCKQTDSPTADCPDVCLKAFWLQELEWVLEDCHKRSCCKNSIGVNVPRPCGSDTYVCSKSCWLCLTVVYWLLECNKVPSWIENPEYVTIYSREHNSIPQTSVTTNYSFNNITINTMTNFDSPSPAQLLRTTPSSPRRSHYQLKSFPRENINQSETQLIQLA
jgi:hypothetical protein